MNGLCYTHTETSKLIYTANQLTGFYECHIGLTWAKIIFGALQTGVQKNLGLDIRGVFETLSNVYDGAFYAKINDVFKLLTISARSSITDV